MFAEHQHRPLSGRKEWAIVVDATSAIGYELAKCCAKAGFHLLIAAHDCHIHRAATGLMALGIKVETVEADLTTTSGMMQLGAAAQHKTVALLFAPVGQRLEPIYDQPGIAIPDIIHFTPDLGCSQPESIPDPTIAAQRIFRITVYGHDTIANILQQHLTSALTAIKDWLSEYRFRQVPTSFAPVRNRRHRNS